MSGSVRLVAAVLALGFFGSGCTDDSGDTTDTTDATTATAGDDTALSSYATIDELAEAIVAADFTCELEYEGLEDATGVVSLCTIGEGQATLRIWTDPADVTALAESGTATELTVYGENWTIDLRDPAVAGDLADALGGTTG